MAVIEPAKSGRSSCRSCKQKIKKSAARLGIETEMTRGDNTFTSTKWYHLDCGINDFPDEIVRARIEEPIGPEEKTKIDQLKEDYNKAGIAIQNISKIDKPDVVVNIEASILKIMKSREATTPDNQVMNMTTAYVKGEEGRSKIFLWGDHAMVKADKGEKIVVIDGKSTLAANDQLQVHAYPESTVLIEPTEEELHEHMDVIELFISNAWNRPTGMPVEFEYAPSGRAACNICEKKIQKGELKVVKPEFIEANNRVFPGNVSYHMNCVIKDEHGEDILHEAITRLSPSMIEENKSELEALLQQLSESQIKTILGKLL